MQKWTEQQWTLLYSEEQIKAAIGRLADDISRDFADIDKPLVVIAMLRGSLYFMADLTRAIQIPLQFDFIAIGSSGPQNEQAPLCITKDVCIDLEGRHVLVLEEIIRTGLTTNLMIEHLEAKKPAKLSLAALCANEEQLLIDLPLDYVGLEIDYTRLLGYGMDYQDKGRNLPFIAQLDKEELMRRY